MAHEFQGKQGQRMPEMPDAFIWEVSDRYVELFEKITGKAFQKADAANVMDRVETNLTNYLKKA